MTTPLPVTTIGGYLGAGKTTLINHLLRHANGLRIAVLVNEFGALAIDEDLIEAEGDDIISIAGGCICCSFGDNLIGAMMDMAQLTPRPDHIVIEASGVAIPGSIAASLSLLQGFRTDGIVVLADAETIRAQADDKYVGDTILRQLHDADLILLTKSDLVTDTDQTALCNWVAQHAPNAQCIATTHGQIAPDVVLGPKLSDRVVRKSDHSDAMFESLSLRDLIITEPLAFANALAQHPDIIRAKGHIIDATGQTHLIHVVGARSNVTSAQKPSAEFVCIGLKGQFDPNTIHALIRDHAL